MTPDLNARIAAARTGQEMHAIAAEAARLNPAEREQLQPVFAARCAELWPRECGARKR